MLSVRKRPAEGLVALVVLVAVGWFYAWTVAPEGLPDWAAKDNQEYYNLLTKGFLQGHLWLDKAPDPFLATLRDPWDPAQRAGHGMHDASYYRGHYYIYFGVTPALVLFLPFRLMTGDYLDERAAVLVFAWIGLAASALLLGGIRRRYFPGASSGAYLAGLVALGLVDMMPALLRRPSIWEVPIACAYACFMIALWALERAAGSSHRRLVWLALGSAMAGGAIGARPDYLPAAVAAGWLGWVWARESAGGASGAWRTPSWRRTLGAALLPLAVIGAGLAAYNFLRFGSILEFGQRYQMSGGVSEHRNVNFGWRFLVYGLRLYWLAPANWSHFFPYVLPISAPAPPPGVLGIEDPYGILPNLPFVAWTLIVGVAISVSGARQLKSALGDRGAPLTAWLTAAALGTLGTTFAVTAFAGYTNRYMVDFLPGLVVLGAVGLLAASAQWADRPWVRRAGGWATGGLLFYSAAFGVLASIRHNELLRVEHPDAYRRLVHWGNWPSQLWDRWRRTQYGPVELRLVFPSGRAGTNEPLVVTGWEFLADYFIVHYEERDEVQFGLLHTNAALLLGEPMRMEPGSLHTLRVDLGSLYPPAGHPYFDAMDPVEARRREETFAIAVDGRPQFQRSAKFYDAVSPVPDLGTAEGRPAESHPFSGRLLGARRLPKASLAPPDRVPGGDGPIRVVLLLPAFTGVYNEPILSSGVTGRGDLVYIRYLGPAQVAFGYDHWGRGGPVSGSVTVIPGRPQSIEIDTAAVNGRNPGNLVLKVNGHVVLDQSEPCYPGAPATIRVGDNSIGASTSREHFAGQILLTERRSP